MIVTGNILIIASHTEHSSSLIPFVHEFIGLDIVILLDVGVIPAVGCADDDVVGIAAFQFELKVELLFYTCSRVLIIVVTPVGITDTRAFNVDEVIAYQVVLRYVGSWQHSRTVVTASVVSQEAFCCTDNIRRRAAEIGYRVGALVGVGDVDFTVAGHPSAFCSLRWGGFQVINDTLGGIVCVELRYGTLLHLIVGPVLEVFCQRTLEVVWQLYCDCIVHDDPDGFQTLAVDCIHHVGRRTVDFERKNMIGYLRGPRLVGYAAKA